MVAPIVLQALAGMANVAKVDIRGSGTLTGGGAVLKQMLATTYAGAGWVIPTSDMTINTNTAGSYVIEIVSSVKTASELDAYWCLSTDPANTKSLFATLATLGTGLSGVTGSGVINCVGASGQGCTASTACGLSLIHI